MEFDDLPATFEERPLTLPSGTLRLDADLSFEQAGAVLATGFPAILGVTAGGGFGLTDDLQLDARLLSLELSPTVHVPMTALAADRAPSIAVTWRFRHQPVRSGDQQLGVSFALEPKLASGSAWVATLAVPMLFSVDGVGRFDVDPRLDLLLFRPVQDFLVVPVAWERELAANIGVGASTGLSIRNFSRISVPFGVHARLTLPSASGPLVDVIGAVDFPFFAGIGGVGLIGIYELDLGVRVYLPTAS